MKNTEFFGKNEATILNTAAKLSFIGAVKQPVELIEIASSMISSIIAITVFDLLDQKAFDFVELL